MNNLTKPDLKKNKKEIVFISNFSTKDRNINKSENEDSIAHFLLEIATKNKIKFNMIIFRKDVLNQLILA